MHEYHIVERVVERALVEAADRKASRITRITLVAGELSGLEESSIRLHFGTISKGILVENAELIVKVARAELECKKRGMVFRRKKDEFNCPACGSSGVSVKTGRELCVEKVETD